jgi:hypothetical protein
MAVQATLPLAPASRAWPRWTVVRRLSVWFAAPRLDVRLAAGEDPSSDWALARRSAQLMSKRARGRLTRGLEQLRSQPPKRPGLSAALPFDGPAVETARPVLEQLASAVRSRESIEPRGVALTQVLLTEPGSALYRPRYTDELYEVAREALLALGDVGVPRGDGACDRADARHERSSPW